MRIPPCWPHNGPPPYRQLLPPEEAKEIPQVAGSLEEALNELDLDREFLKAGGVFTDEAIDAYIALRREEDDRVRMTPHPVEFELYYSV